MLVYLDFNSTMPLLPKVKQGLLSIMDYPLNASATHQVGRQARDLIEKARSKLREALDIPATYKIIFTSTGTEANNLAIQGLKHCIAGVVTSNIEHASVLKIAGEGAIAVDNNGYFSEESIKKNLENTEEARALMDLKPKSEVQSYSQNTHNELFVKKKPQLFSLMLANNEVGTIQDIAKIAKSIKSFGNIVHTDATQAIGKISVSIKDLAVDMMSISSHKFGGPLGAGALIYRENLDLQPLIYGGGQEYRLRSGTVNAMSVHGMGIACDYIKSNCDIMQETVLPLRYFIEEEILSNNRVSLNQQTYSQDKSIIFALKAHRLPNTLSIAMPNVPAEVQVAYFDSKNIAVSAGSACSSAKTASLPHVQLAMGYSYDLAKCAIRVSLGTTTTKKEVELFVQAWHELYRHTQAKGINN